MSDYTLLLWYADISIWLKVVGVMLSIILAIISGITLGERKFKGKHNIRGPVVILILSIVLLLLFTLLPSRDFIYEVLSLKMKG